MMLCMAEGWLEASHNAKQLAAPGAGSLLAPGEAAWPSGVPACVSLPSSFALNMGRAGSDLALHFNPRFESHGDTRIIICNSLQGGEWGEEQREPDFPFQPGQDAKVRGGTA